MSNIFVVSDTHFNHTNVIKYCNRPFESAAEMNQTMVSNWNGIVSPKDTVIHLGDVGWHNVASIVKQLHGRKILVAGNHDSKMNGEAKRLFAHILPIWDTKISHQHVVFCHYPMQSWNRSCHGALHLHGHAHGGSEEPMSYLRWDMSVDLWNFTPVPWDIIMDKYFYKKKYWDKSVEEMPVGRDITYRNEIIKFNKQFMKGV